MSPQNTFSTSGSDIEDALTIIDENGGTGEWESAPDEAASSSIPRWLFPRFPGAENLGTCEEHSDPETGASGIHMRSDDCSEDFTPDTNNMYLSRSGIGPYDTDVEMVTAWLNAPRSRVGGVMILGDPGGGKTSLAQAACTHAEREYETLTATPDHTKDSLLVRFVGDGKGEEGTAFVKAALARAAHLGRALIIDEFWLFVDGVKPLIYPLADGNHWLPEANVDGTTMPIHPETRLIITANPMVRGASLPEPIGSRFAGTTITVETSKDMLLALGIDESIVAAWESLGNQQLWRPQVREMRVADYWLGVDPTQSVSAFLPEHCPESQRKQVRDIVVSHLGGNIREDGRLVVS